MATRQLQISFGPLRFPAFFRLFDAIEARLEAERERVALWLPVALGGGIAAWFALPGEMHWTGALLILCAVALSGYAIGWHRRAGRAMTIAAATAAMGLLLIWTRAWWIAAPVLAQPVATEFSAEIERVEPLPARGQMRLVVRPHARTDLPPRVRLTLRTEQGAGLVAGEHIGVRARLMPPPVAALPGGYDFAQRAWFDRIGAVGTVLGPVARAPDAGARGAPLRARLSAHVQSRVPGSAGGIAAALVSGDRGAISDADAEAMRRSGLAHLLSISGLHVTAVVGFTMLLLMRLLALSERLALRGVVMVASAAGAALAGVGYTWLTGAEVPTIRSCIAALLVLGAFLLGREAITLRLVAAGALLVLLWRPEALAGPSFQLSFAAVTAIIALHENRRVQAFLARREEPWVLRFGRGVVGLLLTGLIVEATLAPIALFHFHKAGLYGALANVIAIPLTTFVIMPAEALALLFDSVGAGAPFWWVADHALRGLIALAHAVADAPGAVATLPVFPSWGFGVTIFGGLWALLWRTGWRWAGVPLALTGMAVLLMQPRPDLLVTGDGRHIAAAMPNGDYALLRDRAGEYVRDSLSEAAGYDLPFAAIADNDAATCNRDFCHWEQGGEGAGRRTILASRGRDRIEGAEMAAACAAADVVISERWLPRECVARWLTIDRDSLETSGGLAIYLGAEPRVATALRPGDRHPWRIPHQLSGNDEAVPTDGPAR
ncbi:ComEC family competence protein [Sphingopyxis sp. XHP0097]|uniref:ComEC family competence protein n=1 Tax=Sphingopyxis jiangsuensis TaxID=2871171 RepID=A0ABS7MDH0_9SPHN|nr:MULTISPECIES: ComEC/Rec2 family competence protein [Sphingopyxis]MBY4637061.1 ComEC family competence protein [Sphingopyxis jiangsuensis]